MLWLLGVPACGLAISMNLRRASLRWTWSLLAAALTLPIAPLVPLTAAFALAALVGARRQRADLAAGGDFATAAMARRGPLDIARASLSARGALIDDDGLALGRDVAGALVRVPLGGRSGAHTLIVGATGSGKTVTESWVVTNAVAHGHGSVVVDPKGDALLRRALEDAAHDAGRPFLEWTPRGPAAYNPFAHGSDSEIADKALAAERYTEPHYQRQAQRYLAHAVRALKAAGETCSPRGLLALLDPQRLELLARRMPDERLAAELFAYLDQLDGRARGGLAGTRDRLAILVESDFGHWLGGDDCEVPQIDLLACVRERAVVYFRLDADRLPLLARMLAAAIVQDLLTVAAECQEVPVPTVVAIDEFSAIAPEAVARLFGRARAAGISLLLATQELADLRGTDCRELLEQVLGNLTTLIAHRQVVPASAELIASVGGTRGAWVTTQQLEGGRPSGRATRTRGREHVIAPDTIRTLDQGCAAVIVASGPRAHVARIFAPAVSRGGASCA